MRSYLIRIGLLVALGLPWSAGAATSDDSSAKDPTKKQGISAFDTLTGWHIKPLLPSINVARFGAQRKSALSGPDHSTIGVDVLTGFGFGVLFQPPGRPWRTQGIDVGTQKRRDVQWLGFSLGLLLKGGTTNGQTSFLNNAELGVSFNIEFLESVSLGVGVDLYRGVVPDGGTERFDTGIMPAAFGAGQMTREDVFFTIMLNVGDILSKTFQGEKK